MKFLPDYLLLVAPPFLLVIALYLILWPHARTNFLAVLLCGWLMLAQPLATVFMHGGSIYTIDWLVLLAVLWAPLVYFAYIQLAPQKTEKS
jgi:hypothetical protein